ncbi:adenylosuccinate lyase [Lachnospiraceae bacterium oral taxon 500]|nr:adenylosuccinate lyase [Lachnospiraceae bacterium oral taxon 500]
MTDYQTYTTPLTGRYASREMQYLFSPEKKFKTWRRLWIILAETEKELGLAITADQIAELKEFAEDINFSVAEEYEKKVRHDVMSHVYAYGDQAVSARGILHLGATSCYVGDNTDLLLMKEGLELLRRKIVNILSFLKEFALKYRELPTLGFTHFQPAQLTTVGKRATLWMQDLVSDLEDLNYCLESLKLRGAKGTTGTQATYLTLFDNDYEKVRELDRRVCQKMGGLLPYPVTGQTYSRKVDTKVLNVLAGIAQSAHKFTNDLRLLQSLKELEEPFAKDQIGSSAMAYKRNPMRCERMAGLARHVIAQVMNPAMTAAEQWLERTLDDSANRRLSVPEAFLATDAILETYMNVADGLVVYENVIRSHVAAELPFMATEMILMEGVKRGGDRQTLHEVIRVKSMEAAAVVKMDGQPNDLLERLAASGQIPLTLEEMKELLSPENFIGAAALQVNDFIGEVIDPILTEHKSELGLSGQVLV